MEDLFLSFGKIAGIGGLSIALILYIFRGVIKKNIFPQLTKEQAYKIIKLIIIFTFSIGAIGLVGYFILENNKNIHTEHAAVKFLPIDDLEEKLKTFDLNPSEPIFKLRFKSNTWKINTVFYCSKNMKISELRYLIMEHFNMNKFVIIDYTKFSDPCIASVYWNIIINGKNNFNDNYGIIIPWEYEGKTLLDLNVKNNDLITLTLKFINECALMEDPSEKHNLPEPIELPREITI